MVATIEGCGRRTYTARSRVSTVVVQSLCKRKVAGSNPAPGTTLGDTVYGLSKNIFRMIFQRLRKRKLLFCKPKVGSSILSTGTIVFAAVKGTISMNENGGFRAHHKVMIAVIGIVAVLAFLYNLGIFDVWSVEQMRK